jgi:serine/threonine-protein kinase
VEVDGKPSGTAPPLNRLTLTEGTHTVTVRNGDFPPFVATVTIKADQPASLKHRFGP